MKFNRIRLIATIFACLMLGTIAASAKSDSENRTVKIVNEASSPVFHLYVSNVDQNNWGPDQLGAFETIGIDRYRVFNMDDGTGHCLFDLKVVLRDGRFAVHRNFNVCTQGSWTIDD